MELSDQMPTGRFSPSVQRAAEALGEEPVESVDLIRSLLLHHGEYGAGLGRSVTLHPTRGPRRPPAEWLLEAAAWVEDRQLDVQLIHGRLLIVALSDLDQGLASELRDSGLLRAVLDELGELRARPTASEATEAVSGAPAKAQVDSSVRILGDDPTNDDLLRRRPFARFLARQLRIIRRDLESTGGPASFLLHIDGPWGSGKTTLLGFMAEALKERPPPDEGGKPWIVVDFNAWRHQRFDPPWWALREAVVRAVISHGYDRRARRRERWWRFWVAVKPKAVAAMLFAVIVALLIIAAERTEFFGLGEASAEPYGWGSFAADLGRLVILAGALWALIVTSLHRFRPGFEMGAQAFLESQRDPMDLLRRHFDKLLETSSHPVAIFIDDLDRCKQSFVVGLIEGIQTLFRGGSVTYVVAGDRRWIEGAFDNEYRSLGELVSDKGRTLGHLFLQKSFQVSVELPPITNTATYWSMLLGGAGAPAFEEREPVPESELGRIRGELARVASPGAIDAKLQEARQSEPNLYHAWVIEALNREGDSDVRAETEHSLHDFHALLDRNPRTMKRFLNGFAIHRAAIRYVDALHELAIDEPWKQLALWTIVQMRWPNLAERLINDPPMLNVALGDEPSGVYDEGVAGLLTDPRVQQVVKGDEVGVSLSEAAIRAFYGLPQASPRTPVV